MLDQLEREACSRDLLLGQARTPSRARSTIVLPSPQPAPPLLLLPPPQHAPTLASLTAGQARTTSCASLTPVWI